MVGLLIVGLALSLFFARALWRSDVMRGAETEANRTIDRLVATRVYYGRAGAQRAHGGGLRVLMDYQNNRTALPLPDTFMRELSRIYSAPKDIAVLYYSPLPFKGRPQHRFDAFQADAWRKLSQGVDDRYSKLTAVGNNDWFRVARAYRMTEKYCIDCHNNHPASQKTDWRVGDLRGIVEVSMNLDERLSGVDRALLSIGMAAIALILGAVVMAGRLTAKAAAGGLGAAGLAGAAGGLAAVETGGTNVPARRQDEAAFSLAAPPPAEEYDDEFDEFEDLEGDLDDDFEGPDGDADFMHDDEPEPPKPPRG